MNEEQAKWLSRLSKDQGLVSLLYDLDLLPEQLEQNTKKWQTMTAITNLWFDHANLLKDLKAVTAHNERIQSEKCALIKERDDLAVKQAHAQMDLESAIAKNAVPSTEVHAQTPSSQQV